MIVYLVLFFFLVLFLFCYKKNGFDLSACMSLLYAISSFVAIFLPEIDSYYKIENISLFPSAVYCLFTWVTIYPFYLYNSNKKREMERLKDTKLFDIICYIFIFAFVFSLISNFVLVESRLLVEGDELRQMRGEHLNSDMDYGYTTTGWMRLLQTAIGVLNNGSFIMIAFFFYSVCFLKKSTFFNILILLSSMSILLSSIITIDRSGVFYWVLTFLLFFLLFKQHIPGRKLWVVTSLMILPLGLVLIWYFMRITEARFGYREYGTEGGLMIYIGQPIFHVSGMWDGISRSARYYYQVMPITGYIFELFFKTPMVTGNNEGQANIVFWGFNTTFGYGVRAVGQLLGLVFIIILFFATNKMICPLHHHKKSSLSDIIIIYLFGIVIMSGFISYYYANVYRAFMFWIFLYLANKMRKQYEIIKYEKQEI